MLARCVSARPDWSAQEQKNYAEMVRILCDAVEPAATDAVRDKNDNPVLGTLMASGAEYLITGDKDLLALAAEFPIITPARFLQRHGA